MYMRVTALTVVWMGLLACGAGFASAGVSATMGIDDFPLVSADGAAPIVIDTDDQRVVAIAASCLAEDVERVSGKKPAVVHAPPPDGPAVIIGSLDRSRAIRALADA